MNKKKKILLISLGVLVVLITGIILAFEFLPVSKLLRRSGVDETQFVMRQGLTAPNTLFFDFEPADSSDYDKNLLFKGIAYSGNFSARAFGKNSYSISVNRNVSEVGPDLMKQVSVSAWIYIFPVDVPVEASLVFTGFNNSVNLVWNGVTVAGKELPMGKWFKVSGKFDLSSVPFTEESRFQVYLWNNSSCDILMDDLYIVMGSQHERIGDTVVVDLTREPYTEKVNYPPFNTIYLHKAAAGPSLAVDGKIASEMILPLNLGRGYDEILVAGIGSARLYSYCTGKSSFVMSKVSLPDEFMGAADLISGRFKGQKDQILAITQNHIYLYEPARSSDPCSNVAGSVSFNPIWEGTFEGSGPNRRFIPADLDGDQTDELVVINENRSWKVLKLTGSSWKELASSESSFYGTKGRMKVTAGRFLQRFPFDLMLVVNSDGNESSYDLLVFNKEGKDFRSFFRNGKRGRTIGPDTLKVNDEFIVDGKSRVFRYNRDWRFDLKEIAFNDTSFTILSNIDFRGYESDRNPKYFENLSITAGNFINTSVSSFFLIQQNPKSGMMPDETGVYVFQQNH